MLEEGLDASVDFASDYATAAMAAIGVNSILGNSAWEMWNAGKNKLSGKDSKSDKDSVNGSTQQTKDHHSNKSSNESELHSNSFNSDIDNLTKTKENSQADLNKANSDQKSLNSKLTKGMPIEEYNQQSKEEDA